LMLPLTWQQNDQSWSLNVEWIIKNPLFYWFLALFLLEAVEAMYVTFNQIQGSLVKCYHLGNMLKAIKKIKSCLHFNYWMISLSSGTSAASMTSTASMASVASTASNHQNTYWAWYC
jgi:hypothetical protein